MVFKDKGALIKAITKEIEELNQERLTGTRQGTGSQFRDFKVEDELLKDPEVIAALKALDGAQTIWSVWKRGRDRENQDPPPPPQQQYLRMAPRLPVFDCFTPDQMPTGRVEEFLEKMGELVEQPGNRSKETLAQLYGEGCSAFKKYIKTRYGETLPNWDTFKSLFRQFFGQRATAPPMYQQRPGENPQQLYVRIYDMFTNQLPDFEMAEARSSAPMLRAIRNNFYEALEPTVRDRIENQDGLSTEALVTRAFDIWKTCRANPQGASASFAEVDEIQRKYGVPKDPARQATAADDIQTQLLKTLTDLVAGLSQTDGRQNFQSSRGRGGFRQRKVFTCFYCHRQGHMAKECRTRMYEERSGKKQGSNRVNELERKVEELQATDIAKEPVKE